MIFDVSKPMYNFYVYLQDLIYSIYIDSSRPILDSMHLMSKSVFGLLLIITIVIAGAYLLMSIGVLFFKKNPQAKLKEGKEPFVTVQIPTYNELAAINCARRCLSFDYPKKKMQIIIGDDSNNPEISAKIDEFTQIHDNVLVTRRGSNAGFKPGNLNYMLKYTKGEYIVIFDSDFLPEPDFLRRIIAPMENDPKIAVVQSRWRIYNFKQNIFSVMGGTISMICHFVALTFIKKIGGNSFLCGSAEAVRKKELLEAGGWKEGCLTEDIECSFRMIKNGKKLLYLEDLECDCEAPFTLQDLCKQQMRWAFGVISSFKMHFAQILLSKKTKLQDKIGVFIFVSGYIFSFILLLLTLFGLLSLLSDRPAPIDWPRFISETGMNILLTSGFIITSVVALSMARRPNQIPKMIASSLSVGLVVTYYVNVGVLKAVFGRNMKWFMLNKNGNRQ